MRVILNTLMLLMVVAAFGFLLLQRRGDEVSLDRRDAVRQSLDRLHEKLQEQLAYERSKDEKAGYPEFISPLWFSQDDLPCNFALPAKHPWMDVAPRGDLGDHPPDLAAGHLDQAGLWYNPNNGIVRARVPAGFTDSETLRAYNEINGTTLAAMPAPSEERRARALPLVLANSRTLQVAENGEEKKAPKATLVDNPGMIAKSRPALTDAKKTQ